MGQAFGGRGQDSGGEIPGGDPEQDPEPGVVDDPLEVAPALLMHGLRSPP